MDLTHVEWQGRMSCGGYSSEAKARDPGLRWGSSSSTCSSSTCLGTSQQNGRAERKFHHILDTVRTFILPAKGLAPFWGEAVLHVVHAINHIPVLSSKIKLHMSAFLGHL